MIPVYLVASDTWLAAAPAQSCAETAAAATSPCTHPSSKLSLYLLLAPAAADAAASPLLHYHVTDAVPGSKSELVQLACLSLSLCCLHQHQQERSGPALVWHQGSG